MDSSNVFVVMFHGFYGNPSRFASIKKSVENIYPKAIFYSPKLNLEILSFTNIDVLIEDLLDKITDEWEKIDDNEKKTTKIILIGNSMGGVISRKVYLQACENYSVNKDKKYGWSEKVERNIYFAAVLRGWSISTHYKLLPYFGFKLMELLGKALQLVGLKSIGMNFKKGSSFINEIRIQSLRLQSKKVGNALNIQLLGTEDGIVSPEDTVDSITANHFVYIDVPFSNHLNILNFDGERGETRKAVFEGALVSSLEILEELDYLPYGDHILKQDFDVTDVVFVIHGIRDFGHWTIKLANKVKNLGDKEPNRIFKMETSKYGYFPMGAFLLMQLRRSKVEWLMERYTENLALYPNAKFSFIGHSNGTYLLAKALQDYPSCKFKNVVLAGSVVEKNYDWTDLKIKGRIENIYNFVANNDWVVGIFPKTFQTLKLQDLGSGGFDGFSTLENDNEFKYVQGGHGAAVKEYMWDEIAYVTVHGNLRDNHNISKPSRSKVMTMIGFLSPVLFLILILLLLLVPFFLFQSDLSFTLKFIFLSIYLFIIYKILTWL